MFILVKTSKYSVFRSIAINPIIDKMFPETILNKEIIAPLYPKIGSIPLPNFRTVKPTKTPINIAKYPNCIFKKFEIEAQIIADINPTTSPETMPNIKFCSTFILSNTSKGIFSFISLKFNEYSSSSGFYFTVESILKSMHWLSKFAILFVSLQIMPWCKSIFLFKHFWQNNKCSSLVIISFFSL